MGGVTVIYIITISITIALKFVLKLNIISTILAGTFLLIMQFFHRKKYRNYLNTRARFADTCVYIEILLNSFMKERKIVRAFEDVVNTLDDGKMRKVVENALQHMQMTFDDTEVLADSMKIIEGEYECNRIRNVHDFMIHVEYYGGEIEGPARLLLRDKYEWENRVNSTIMDRNNNFVQILLSVIASLIICGVILYLPVLNMDISQNILVQIISVAVIFIDDLIILKGQNYLEVDYLTIDMLEDNSRSVNKLQEYKSYDEKNERRKSFFMSLMPMLLTAFFVYAGSYWYALFMWALTLLFLNQHIIGRRIMKNNLLKEIRSAFPKWLMDIALLIQTENVNVAIRKSRQHVPKILEKEVDELIDRLDFEPESSKPYHRFLAVFGLPEISAAMGTLYSISVGNGENHGRQIEELISKNMMMLDRADTQRMKDKSSGMFLLFLAPVLTASFKLLVDMAVFLLGFLSYRIM